MSTFLRIPAVLSNAAFCKSSTVAVTPIVFRCFPRLFVTVPNAPTTIGTTDVIIIIIIIVIIIIIIIITRAEGTELRFWHCSFFFFFSGHSCSVRVLCECGAPVPKGLRGKYYGLDLVQRFEQVKAC